MRKNFARLYIILLFTEKLVAFAGIKKMELYFVTALTF